MKRRAPAARRPSLPVCARHQRAYELQGGRPVCRFCQSEAAPKPPAEDHRDAP